MCLPFVRTYSIFLLVPFFCLPLGWVRGFFGSRLIVSQFSFSGGWDGGFLLLCVCSPRYLSLHSHLCLHSNCHLRLSVLVFLLHMTLRELSMLAHSVWRNYACVISNIKFLIFLLSIKATNTSQQLRSTSSLIETKCL